LWSWGGREVEADGKTVKLNSKETIESIKFMTAFWKEAHDEGGLAWDDSNNNRAFLSGTISATLNGASIYIEALRKPDQYKTEKGAQLKTDILLAALPSLYNLPAKTIVTGLPFLITWPVVVRLPELVSTRNVTTVSPASLAA